MANDNFLLKNESKIAAVRFSVAAFVGIALQAIFLFCIGIFFLMFPGMGIIIQDGFMNILYIVAVAIAFIWSFYDIIKIIVIVSTNQLVVTNKRLFGRVGVFKKETIDIPLTKLDNVNVKRNFWGAIFGYNTIIVSSSVSNFEFRYAANANEFKAAIFEAQDLAKEDERKEKARSMAEAIAMAKGASQDENK